MTIHTSGPTCDFAEQASRWEGAPPAGSIAGAMQDNDCTYFDDCCRVRVAQLNANDAEFIRHMAKDGHTATITPLWQGDFGYVVTFEMALV